MKSIYDKFEYLNNNVFMHDSEYLYKRKAIIKQALKSFYKSGLLCTVGADLVFDDDLACPDISVFAEDNKEADIRAIVEVVFTLSDLASVEYKKHLYEIRGISELWIVDRIHNMLEMFVMRDHKFVLCQKLSNGVIKSNLFPTVKVDANSVIKANSMSKFTWYRLVNGLLSLGLLTSILLVTLYMFGNF